MPGPPFTFDVWGRLTGRPGNTLSSWCDDGEAYQIQALLVSLERLPETQRHQILDDACRVYPTLAHRKLSHDFVAVSRLTWLLQQTVGLSFIEGNSDHMRTFLLSALGHSFRQRDAATGIVSGLDVHRPESFVPVEGVLYLNDLLRTAELEQQARQAWLAICNSGAALFLFNGIWGKVPGLRGEIVALADHAHVIVADSQGLKSDEAVHRISSPVHRISVSAATEAREWLRVEIERL